MTFAKAIFSTNHCYGDLDRCIKMFLSLVTQCLDELSRSYEQKTSKKTRKIFYIENYICFDIDVHGYLGVDIDVNTYVIFNVKTFPCLFLNFFAHSSSRAGPNIV